MSTRLPPRRIAQFDPRNGGFGSQPKFPHPAALDLLLQLAVNRGNAAAREAFTVTLEKMARGGVYDQLAGGFHRYSVDERWVVPHFEKMLYDNTELLRNYVHGFQSFVREDFRQTAREIVGWLDSMMTDRERGGFYASQDADINLDDDGDYFTWTLDEARAVLTADELDFAACTGTSANWATCTTIRRKCAASQIHAGRAGRTKPASPLRELRLADRSRTEQAACRALSGPRHSSIARSTPAGTRWP